STESVPLTRGRSMTESVIEVPLAPDLAARVLPTLTPAQAARLAAAGRPRVLEPGEVVLQHGEPGRRIYFVRAGQLEARQPTALTERRIFALRAGQFTGEIGILSGQRAMVSIRATQPSEVIEIDRERLVTLIQNDGELGEIFMRAYILRR